MYFNAKRFKEMIDCKHIRKYALGVLLLLGITAHAQVYTGIDMLERYGFE